MTTTSSAPPAPAAPTAPPSSGELASWRALARRSHEVITAHQAPGGAYPASPTFSAYAGYAWYRDGAFTAEGVSRYGDAGSAGRFHDWAQRVLVDRREAVVALVAAAAAGERPADGQMLPTRFTLDGHEGSDPWWDFQTDGYGTWLWSLLAHADRHDVDPDRWRDGVELAVDYLAAFWHRPCYDWWEEHVEQRHVSTLGAVAGGLRDAAGSGLLDAERTDRAGTAVEAITAMVRSTGMHDAHLAKWLGSTEVDASLAACVVPFRLVEPGGAVAEATLAAVRDDLDVGGGVHRYRADVFYGGGQWPLLTALLGWNDAVARRTDAAWDALRWVAAQATDEGHLPEQVPHHLLAPEHRDEWVRRWGPVATPLLWSHGMYLVLADELGVLEAEEVPA